MGQWLCLGGFRARLEQCNFTCLLHGLGKILPSNSVKDQVKHILFLQIQAIW